MRRNETTEPIWIKLHTVVGIPDIITCTNSSGHLLRGFWGGEGHRRPYNTLAPLYECLMSMLNCHIVAAIHLVYTRCYSMRRETWNNLVPGFWTPFVEIWRWFSRVTIEKLPSIDDRGQTDLVNIRSHALDSAAGLGHATPHTFSR